MKRPMLCRPHRGLYDSRDNGCQRILGSNPPAQQPEHFATFHWQLPSSTPATKDANASWAATRPLGNPSPLSNPS